MHPRCDDRFIHTYIYIYIQRARQRLKRPERYAKRMSRPISKAYKEAKPNKPQKYHKCGKRGHYRRDCEAKTSHLKIGNPEHQELSPTQPLV